MMFELPPLTASQQVRTGGGLWWSEVVASFALLVTIYGAARQGFVVVAAAVACFIGAAYWFTASTSFANPAVTLARAATDTFTGIRPADVPGFVAAQTVGAFAAWCLLRLTRKSN